MKISYYAFLLAEKLIDILPESVSRVIARFVAVTYYYAFSRKRVLVMKNMRRALGSGFTEREVRKTARRAALFYADYWIDFYRVGKMNKERVLERFELKNEEILEEVASRGNGILIVLPHYGSWEAGAVYLTTLGNFAAVAEVIKPMELFELFVKQREKFGIRIYPYDHNAETREKIVEALKDGQILALLCDRDLKGTGVEVEFFGEKTTLPPGPAVFSMKSGAPIFCVNVRNKKDGWVGRITEPIYANPDAPREKETKRIMQMVAERLEELIQEDPAQWHMFMSAWPSDRK
ncbi:MAG: phosphatidylinositol mannoside acyltransferase [Actinomycetota bacterium]|nr:phosphatidylinositol mannoside acyltransferase [Actinomycetota bacterium]